MSALGLGCASSLRAEWKIDLPEGGVGFNFGNLIGTAAEERVRHAAV